jgi:hypothetical protein
MREGRDRCGVVNVEGGEEAREPRRVLLQNFGGLDQVAGRRDSTLSNRMRLRNHRADEVSLRPEETLRRGTTSFLGHNHLINLLNVLAKFFHRFPLAEDAGDFQQPANKPIAVRPVLKRKSSSHFTRSKCVVIGPQLQNSVPLATIASRESPCHFTGSIANVNDSAITVPARGNSARPSCF